MNLLLDTHVILWWYENPRLLKRDAVKVIENLNNEVFVSAVVLWEIAIKVGMGKLSVPDEMLDRMLNDFTELPITALHAREVKDYLLFIMILSTDC